MICVQYQMHGIRIHEWMYMSIDYRFHPGSNHNMPVLFHRKLDIFQYLLRSLYFLDQLDQEDHMLLMYHVRMHMYRY